MDDLIRSINRAVMQDTGGWSPPGAIPEIPQQIRDAIEPLAMNTDVVTRLLPMGAGVHDRRPEIRVAVKAVVGYCAAGLEPDNLQHRVQPGDWREPTDWAIHSAYAETAPPRLMREVLPDGGAAELGEFPERQRQGYAAAGWSLAVSLASRTGRSPDEELRDLVGAGSGGGGRLAALALLGTKHGYYDLTPLDQDRIADVVTNHIESRFAPSDVERPLRDVPEGIATDYLDRVDNVELGAEAIDRASEVADREIWQHQRDAAGSVAHILDPALQMGVEQQVRVEPPIQAPETLQELLQRIEAGVQKRTGAPQMLWNGGIAELPAGDPSLVAETTDGTLLLNRDLAALPLRELTAVDGPHELTPEQAESARAAFQEVSGAFARLAVPYGHTHESEQAAAAIGQFEAKAQGTSAEFAKDHFKDLVEAEQAAQLKAAPPPQADTKWGPVIRGLANAVDNAKGLQAWPSETLRAMAGEGRSSAVSAAAEALVRDTKIAPADRLQAVFAVEATIHEGFATLPATFDGRSEAWMYGQELGQQAGRQVAELEKQFPQAQPGVQAEVARFGVADPAMTPLGKAQAPGSTPTTARSAGVEQPGPRTQER